MSDCLQCRKPIDPVSRRLRFSGRVSWTAAPGPGTPEEQALTGDAQFCSIRCLGTYIGVTLESRGLIPPKGK